MSGTIPVSSPAKSMHWMSPASSKVGMASPGITGMSSTPSTGPRFHPAPGLATPLHAAFSTAQRLANLQQKLSAIQTHEPSTPVVSPATTYTPGADGLQQRSRTLPLSAKLGAAAAGNGTAATPSHRDSQAEGGPSPRPAAFSFKPTMSATDTEALEF
jgi:hypothetical protein